MGFETIQRVFRKALTSESTAMGTHVLEEEGNEAMTKKDLLKQSCSTCPPMVPMSTIVALIIIVGLLYGTLWGLMGPPALPGGPIFALFVLVIVCYLGGKFVRLCGVPSLVGMILLGFMLRNTPHIDVANDIPEDWAGNIRNIALVLILLRAGLEVDSNVLKSNPGTCLRLILLPFIVECTIGGLVAHFLLDIPWEWSFLLGFMLAAVSPAVVLPVMLKLQKKGIGVTNGIPTLVIAVAGIDDVLALTGFEIVLGITFSKGNLGWTIAKGPVEVLAGIIYGVILGIISWYIPNPFEKSKSVFRVIILAFGGMFIMFGSEALDFGAAGALGCICLPFVAAIKWKTQDWDEEDNPVGNALSFVWRIIEPFLFGLIGTEIRINELEANTIGLGLAILFIALALRMVASLLAAFGAGLSLKEQIFVTFAGVPKATVQAAIGPVALMYARRLNMGPNYEEYGIQILTVAVLAILITAPFGATAIALLAPRLLDSDEDVEKCEKKKPRLDEARVSIFDDDSSIYTIARL